MPFLSKLISQVGSSFQSVGTTSTTEQSIGDDEVHTTWTNDEKQMCISLYRNATLPIEKTSFNTL